MPEFEEAENTRDTNYFSLSLQYNEVLNFHNKNNVINYLYIKIG